MHPSPALVLVDPRAQHRAAVRQRLCSLAVGALLAAASTLPLLLTAGR